METTNSTSLIKTAVGVPFALLAWALIYTAAHVALYLLDSTRGLADDGLQKIFREWFTPGVGGYAAVFLVNKYLPAANLKWVSILFCTPLVLFYVGLSLYIIIFHGEKFDYSLGEQVLQWGMAIATCVGAYFGYRTYASDDA